MMKAIDVPCPKCRVKKGERCRNYRGGLKQFCPARFPLSTEEGKAYQERQERQQQKLRRKEDRKAAKSGGELTLFSGQG